MKKVIPPYPKLTKEHYLIDTHCHLDMELYNNDLEDLLSRASSHNVKSIISIGVAVSSSSKAIQLAKKYKNVHATIGVHPHDIDSLTDNDYQKLRTLYELNQNYIVGYGEIGLDYVKMHCEPKNQRFHFNKQLELAIELDLPIVVHNREADTDTLEILSNQQNLPRGGVMHCFSGDYCFAKSIIDLGMIISIPGIVTFKNATTLHDVVKKIPIDCIIIETDGPFLSPHPFRGKRNEPANILYTAQKIAEIKQLDINKVAEITTNNARKLFNLKKYDDNTQPASH